LSDNDIKIINGPNNFSKYIKHVLLKDDKVIISDPTLVATSVIPVVVPIERQLTTGGKPKSRRSNKKKSNKKRSNKKKSNKRKTHRRR